MAEQIPPAGLAPLPDFEDPPVVEVALGVQFRPIPALRPVELAGLREQWRNEFPIVTDQPPVPPAIEQPTSGPSSVQLVFGPALQTRLWFLGADESMLIQVQHDRLTANWRKIGDSPYPRYPAVRQLFEDRFADLAAFLTDREIGNIDVTQVEVNYTNAIELGGDRLGHLDAVLRHWAPPEGHHLGVPEEARIALVFPVTDMGRPPVRMYVGVDPARQIGREPFAFLTLTVRGAPTAGDLGATLEFMDGAHVHVVNSFAELTPPEMHETWRRTR
jgi:uncharacterized protein (TIGR04255 family)